MFKKYSILVVFLFLLLSISSCDLFKQSTTTTKQSTTQIVTTTEHTTTTEGETTTEISDSQLVQQVVDTLDIGDVNHVSSNLNLPTEAQPGITISWVSSQPNIVSNTGVVTRPAFEAENAEVTLTATITLNSVSVDKVFTLIVLKELEPTTSTIADAKTNHAINSVVAVEGVVTSIIGNNVFIQDETAGIYIYMGSTNGGFQEGDLIHVKGTITNYKGLIEITSVTDYQVIGTSQTIPSPKVFQTISDLNSANVQGELVTLEEVMIIKIGTIAENAYNVTVQDKNGASIILRIDGYLNPTIDPITFTEGAIVDVTAPLGCYNDPQLMLRSAADVVGQLTDIATARAITDNTEITIQGIVTTVIGNNAFIQDETAGIYVYAGNTVSTNLVVGNEVAVKGTITTYHGLVEISPSVIFNLNEGIITVPVSYASIADLLAADVQGELVLLNELKITNIAAPADLTSSYSITVEDVNLDTIDIRIDSHFVSEIPYTTFTVGDVISAIGPLGCYDNPQILVTSMNSINGILNIETVRAVTDETQVIKTKGIVTAVIGNNAFIQDETAGIYIYAGNTSYTDLIVGNEVEVTGNVTIYHGLVELEPSTITMINQNISLPTSIEFTNINDLFFREDVQGQLVTLKEVLIIEIGTTTPGYNVTVLDQYGDSIILRVDNKLNPLIDPTNFTVGDIVDVTAPVGYYDNPELMLSSSTDVVSQLTDIDTARGITDDSEVLIKGVVTAVIGNNAFIQDETAGIFIYAGNKAYTDLVVGNEVAVKGTIDTYYGLVEILPTAIYKTDDNTIIVPASYATIADLNAANVQGQLVMLDNLTITAITVPADLSTSYSITVQDANSDTIDLRIDSHFVSEIPYTTFTVGDVISAIGPLGCYNNPQIMITSLDSIKGILNIATVRSVTDDTQVIKTKGIVTAVIGNNAFIQDETAGIYIYANATSYPDLVVGNEVEVTGTVTTYHGLVELEPSSITMINQNVTLPTPIEFDSINDLVYGDVQGQLVTLKEVMIIEIGNTTPGYNVTVLDQYGDSLILRIDTNLNPTIDPINFTVGDIVNVTAPVGCYDNPQLMLRSTSDVVSQLTDIEIARGIIDNSEVLIKGVVTAVIRNNAYIQDETGGIYIYVGNTPNPDIVVGNEVAVKGTIDTYHGLVEIIPTDIYKTAEGIITVPISYASISDLLTADVQGQLVMLDNLTITAIDIPDDLTSSYSITVEDANSDTIIIRVDSDFVSEIPYTNFTVGDIISAIGPLGCYDDPQIMVTSLNSINGILDIKTVRAVTDSTQVIKTKGVVTAVIGNDAFIQDETAGIYIYVASTPFPDLVVGNEVIVAGTVTNFFGMIEILPSAITMINENVSLPTPIEYTSIEALLGEDVQGELVTLKDVMIIEIGTTSPGYDVTVQDMYGDTIIIRIDGNLDPAILPATFTVGDIVNVTAPVGCYNEPQLTLASPNDVISQLINIEIARGITDNSEVMIKGVVSAVIGNNAFIQDSTAGIYIYAAGITYPDLVVGNEVAVRGLITTYHGLVEILPISINKLKDATLPVPTEFTTIADLRLDNPQGELISINELIVQSILPADDFTSGADITVTDGVDTIVIRIDIDISGLFQPGFVSVGDVINVTGPLGYFDDIQIMLTSAVDVSTDVIDIVDARNITDSSQVTMIKGIVTAIVDNKAYIQDSTAGICINTGMNTYSELVVGNEVAVKGTIAVLYGEKQITPQKIILTQTNMTLPAPNVFDSALDIYSANPQGQLIKLVGTIITVVETPADETSGYQITLTDVYNETIFIKVDAMYASDISYTNFVKGQRIDVTGPLGCEYSQEIMLTSMNDFIVYP